MTETEHGPTVLILDQDVGFVFWLGTIFSEAGCQVLPGLDYAQAVSLTDELNLTLDIVVINPGLLWVEQVLNTLVARGGTPKIVAISEATIDAVETFQVHATLRRPMASQPISREEWVQRIQEILRTVLG